MVLPGSLFVCLLVLLLMCFLFNSTSLLKLMNKLQDVVQHSEDMKEVVHQKDSTDEHSLL